VWLDSRAKLGWQGCLQHYVEILQLSQRDGEAASAIVGNYAACIASMALRDLSHQCQAQSGSDASAAAAAPIEGFEHVFEFGLQGAWTVIPHRNNGGAVRAGHPHLGWRDAVTLGIFQQVTQQAA
jgi:hypothetical protein